MKAGEVGAVKTAFVVQHVHELGDDCEDVKLIGVYSSREQAEAAVARLRSSPGFRDAPHGFSVDPYEIDRDHWVEGFVSLSGDEEKQEAD